MLGRFDEAAKLGAHTTQTFRYDPYGGLIRVDTWSRCSSSLHDPNFAISQNCPTFVDSLNYTYDNVGNRTDLGATYYAGNRLALFSGGWYTYDADGNVHQKYGVSPNPHNQIFYWNPGNRLDSLSYDGYYNVTYKYNALGKPVLKYRQGTLDGVWLWDGDTWLAEFNSSNHRDSEYLYNGTDQPYASVEGSTTPSSIHYHEQDALGNVLGTYAGTTVTETISYDPWGAPTYTGDLSSRVMWKGLMWEGGPATGDVVGLYYVRGRWYDPQAGRFVQEDPMGVDGGINVYTFAGDDPINGSDPSGMDPDFDPAAFCSGYGFDYVSFSNGNGACVTSGAYQEPAFPVTAPGDPAAPPPSWFDNPQPPGDPIGAIGNDGGNGPGQPTAGSKPKAAPSISRLTRFGHAVTSCAEEFGMPATEIALGLSIPGLPVAKPRLARALGSSTETTLIGRLAFDTGAEFRTSTRVLGTSRFFGGLGRISSVAAPYLIAGAATWDLVGIGLCTAQASGANIF